MILLPVIWAALSHAGMTPADLATISQDALIAKLLVLEDEMATRSDNPFRDVITPDLAALIARRLKAKVAA